MMNREQEGGAKDEQDVISGGDSMVQKSTTRMHTSSQNFSPIQLGEHTGEQDLADVCQGLAELKSTLCEMEQNQIGKGMSGNFSRVDVADLMAVVEPFSGDDGIPVKLWIEEFETACVVLGVSPNRYWLNARRLLTGPAKAYFVYQAATEWEALRSEMIDVFGRKSSKMEICEQLKRRKQRNGETAFQYFITMCGLARQAELEDRDVIRHIVSGLNDKNGITSSLYFCESLSQLRRRLMEYDQIRLSMPNRNAGYAVASGQEMK